MGSRTTFHIALSIEPSPSNQRGRIGLFSLAITLSPPLLLTPHPSLSHAHFKLNLLADGYDIRTVQELLRHSDVRTTMIYTHVLNRGGRGVCSPADVLARRRHG